MLAWKEAAKTYRSVATNVIQLVQDEQVILVSQNQVVAAAVVLKEVLEKKINPYVKLVNGRDINVEKALKNLFKSLETLDKVIQTYSQNKDAKTSSEKLDNVSSV